MSILDKLSGDEERVFNIELSKCKSAIFIEEACDGYFNVELNKYEFGLLIDELKEIHATMVVR